MRASSVQPALSGPSSSCSAVLRLRTRARDVIGPLHDAGATWWDERQVGTGDDLDRLSPVPRRVEAGPPVL